MLLTEPIRQQSPGAREAPSTVPKARAFDRVADARAGAMRLDIGDLARVDPGVTVHSAQQRFLRRLVGHRQARGTAIRIDARADDDGIDRILLGDRLRERLQNDDRAAFRPDITVAGRVEGAASAGRRQHARLREADGRRTATTAHGRRPQSPSSIHLVHKLTQASCTATSDDEQAVSTVKLGPCKSKM